MTKSRAFVIVLLLFVLSVLLRLPNLNRIVSKHHEFNTAIVLINMQSWRQAGGGFRFHFIPLLNYQNPGDKLPPKAYFSIDSVGNLMYISFGPAWYVIPYFFYELLNLPVKPVYLQIINLFFNLALTLLFFYLLNYVIPAENKNKYPVIICSCFFLIYSPCMLWYLGNGYTNIGIMMPFVITFFFLITSFIIAPKNINTARLLMLFINIIILVYFDWFIITAWPVVTIALLFKLKNNKKYIWPIAVISLAVIAGLTLMFWQFASYAGWHIVSTYWLSRIGDRSIINFHHKILNVIKYILQNFMTSYLPVLVLLLISFLILKRKKIILHFSGAEKIFIAIYTASVILYNLVLSEWTSEHEYAIIPWSILFSFVAAKIIIAVFRKQQLTTFIILFFVATMLQYYFINRPGKISREGTPYASFKSFGDSLRQVPADYKIFINMKYNPMIEFYAGRNLYVVTDYDSALRYMRNWNVSKAVWIAHDNFDFRKIITIP